MINVELKVKILKDQTEIALPDNQGRIVITRKLTRNKSANRVTLSLKAGKLVGVQSSDNVDADRIITIQPTWDLEPAYLAKRFAQYAVERGTFKANPLANTKIPSSQLPTIDAFRDLILTILVGLGFELFATSSKTPKGKPRHRWTKKVSQVAFKVDYDGSRATVYWRKRNEMLLKAGAVMKPKPELNKDGSLGFSAKFAERLRSEHLDAVANFVTTKDIVLKSVNEVGLFLYFGGTNSWLVLKDEDGKSIEAWTIVKN